MLLSSIILFPYWLTLKLRHAFFDTGRRKTRRSEVPTLCVGNLAVGGTGKTPHTEMILDLLQRSDEWGNANLAVLSRGYKRKSKGFQQVTRDGTAALYGDEPLQIKKKFPAVTVAVDKDRLEGCRFLCHPETLQDSKKARKCLHKDVPRADLVVLDDAFQYRPLQADLNIVLIDWNRPLDRDGLMPLGRLRDLPQRLRAADIVIVTKCPAYMEDWERMEWAKRLGIKNFRPDTCAGEFQRERPVKLFFTQIVYCPMKPVFESGDPHYIYSKKLVLFSGIAKDTPLRRYLSDRYQVVRKYRFPDHHAYSAADIRTLSSAARQWPTAVVATTEKDSQRILDCKAVPDVLQRRLFQVPIETAFLTDREKECFTATLLERLRTARRQPL
jgi:tetraacyldisaccharide 4'-kinase